MTWARPGLAQQPGRQQETVAGATAIQHTEFQVALQGQVLQAVVGHDDLGGRVGRQQRSGGLNAAKGNKRGCPGALANQQAFVTHLLCEALCQNFAAVRRGSAMTAGNHAHLPALGPQVIHQGHDDGRFAHATDHHTADHNDWDTNRLNAQPPPTVERPPKGGQRPKCLGQWPQQVRQPPSVLPRAQQPGFKLQLPASRHGRRA